MITTKKSNHQNTPYRYNDRIDQRNINSISRLTEKSDHATDVALDQSGKGAKYLNASNQH